MHRPSNGPPAARGPRRVRVAAALALALAAAPAAARGGPAPAAEAARSDVRFVLDDFEDPTWPVPALWSAPAGATTQWRPSACRARRGQRALRAFAPPGGDAACAAAVAPGAVATVWLHLDLRAATAAHRLELDFETRFLLAAADGAGLVVWLLLPGSAGAPERVPVFGATGDSGAWTEPARHLDLRNLVDIRRPGAVYDLRGGQWTLEWTAAAPQGAPPGGGVEIDDLSLVWEPDPSFPTPTRLAPPTATATRPPPTPTPSPVPTVEPTPTAAPPTATPTGARAYLPLVRLDPPPTPTPTDTPSATPTAAPSDTPTPDGTAPAPTTATAEATATAAGSSTPASGSRSVPDPSRAP